MRGVHLDIARFNAARSYKAKPRELLLKITCVSSAAAANESREVRAGESASFFAHSPNLRSVCTNRVYKPPTAACLYAAAAAVPGAGVGRQAKPACLAQAAAAPSRRVPGRRQSRGYLMQRVREKRPNGSSYPVRRRCRGPSRSEVACRLQRLSGRV